MAKITVQVERQGEDGTITIDPVILDVSFESLSMREAVTLEETLGTEAFDQLMASRFAPESLNRPTIIRALIFAKLRTIDPGAELGAFDLDLGELSAAIEEEETLPKADSGGGSSG